jgi:hypothetical protein
MLLNADTKFSFELSGLKSTEECSSLILSLDMLCCCLIIAVTEQQVVVAITLKICTWEVLSWNFSWDACCPGRVFHGFPQFPVQVFEQAKTFHALDCAATVIGLQ